jgi:hypothetical protein
VDGATVRGWRDGLSAGEEGGRLINGRSLVQTARSVGNRTRFVDWVWHPQKRLRDHRRQRRRFCLGRYANRIQDPGCPLKLLDCGGTHDNLVLLKKYFRDVPGIASTSGGRSCPHDLEHDDVVMDLAAAGFGLAFGGRR